ncbi:MAG: tRNA 2-thiocytidine(32) synthetase TtcA [Alistipes sp.]|nr:tRNA 2-thiocytidine(32) synthetase TtcA [Alistipes sp.]
MQRVLGDMRKAVQQYDMISDGDKIAVGVSGGKDSLVLLEGLFRLRKFLGIDFEIAAITVDPQFGGVSGDYSAVSELCRSRGVEYHILPTQIGEIVFDVRREKSPCSLCARMRRGALHGLAGEIGCNKLALGHNLEDAVETFMMNLLTEGRIGCFSPVTVLEDRQLTIIRPLVLCHEKEIKKAARTVELPVVKSKCPADGHTNRQRTKELINDLEHRSRGVKERILGAMIRGHIDKW